MIELLDHPRAAPQLSMPCAPYQDSFGLVQLIDLLVSSSQVDWISKNCSICEAAAGIAQHSHKLHDEAFNYFLVTLLSLLKGLIVQLRLRRAIGSCCSCCNAPRVLTIQTLTTNQSQFQN